MLDPEQESLIKRQDVILRVEDEDEDSDEYCECSRE
jgi:hypothetical protein